MGLSEFVQKVMEHNFCTWYLLPLIRLNKDAFGFPNFIESYVSPQGSRLLVAVRNIEDCMVDVLRHPTFISTEKLKDCDLLKFGLPDLWADDFSKFKLGLYSQLSDDAKNMIITYSGLRYLNDTRGSERTDARILALEKSDVLRSAWEMELGLNERGNDEISHSSELLDPPKPETFLDI